MAFLQLAELIRNARLASGLSQHEVAQRLAVTQPTISNWETGRVNPSKKQIALLESFLGQLSPTSSKLEPETVRSEVSPFGVWLNAARIRKHLTPVELARKAGLSAMTVYNLESGRIDNPQQRTKQALTKVLGEELSQEAAAATEKASAIEGLGNLIDFDPHDEEALPDSPGVYMFYDVSDRPVYVGESKDISGRIREHTEKFWFKRPIVEYGSYIEIREEKLRKQIERILIKFLKSNAVLNKQHVERDEPVGTTASRRRR